MRKLLLLALLPCSSWGATLSWTNPTEWTDTTPYDMPGFTRIKYQVGILPAVLDSLPCNSGMILCETVDWPATTATIATDQPGVWTVLIYAVSAPQGPDLTRIFSSPSDVVFITIPVPLKTPNPVTGVVWTLP